MDEEAPDQGRAGGVLSRPTPDAGRLRTRSGWSRTAGNLSAALCLAVLESAIAFPGEGPSPVPPPISSRQTPDLSVPSLGSLLWSTGVTLRTSAGYHDNPRLSALNREGSSFVAGGVELVAMRLPVDGHEASVFASVDHRGYLERGFASETLAAADARYHRRWESGWSLGTSAEYLFLKQVFDASEIEGVPAVVLTQGHAFTGRPVLGRDFSPAWRLELEGEVTRQGLDEPLDGYFDVSPRLGLTHTYGERCTLTVSHRFRSRSFDERNPRDAAGSDLPETLQYAQHETELAWRHAWGSGGRWRTVLRPGWVANADNGNGFFDYERFQVAATVRWVGDDWEARVDGRWRAYRFPGQPGGTGGDAARRRHDLNVTVRADWKAASWFRIFAQYELDQTDENTLAADFRAHVFGVGLEVEP